jgi:hypothetical protein
MHGVPGSPKDIAQVYLIENRMWFLSQIVPPACDEPFGRLT